MATGTENRRPRRETTALSEGSNFPRGTAERHEQGTVEIGHETVEYEVRIVDARSEEQRARDERRGRPDGNLIVVVPGHGLTVDGPKRLVAAAALLSKSKIAWCIDPTPAKGGDRAEAQALARIVMDRVSAAFPALGDRKAWRELPAAVTLIGWSHGGAEALRAAEADPDLFPQILGLCPAGLVNRHPLELVFSFVLEVLRILGEALYRRDWPRLKDALRMGANILRGLIQDLLRSGSPKRLIEDVGWAGRKVLSRAFDYPGEVVLLLGQQDTVIRWRDVFPHCEHPSGIPERLQDFRKRCFPHARRVEVAVIEGDHLSPETEAHSFVRLGLRWLDQLDESVPMSADAER